MTMVRRLISALRRFLPAPGLRRGGASRSGRTQSPAATWLWVIRDDPKTVREVGHRGWWTCDPATGKGDLALVYRTAPNKDIAYLVRVTSDPVPREPDDGVPSKLPTACDYVVVARFARPLKLAEFRDDPALRGWHALQINFNRAAHSVPRDVWRRLLERLEVDADRLSDVAEQALLDFWLERDIEKHLVREPDRFELAGYGDIASVKSQKHFPNGRIADLVLTLSSGDAVVVELKRGRVTLDAVHQLEAYRTCQREETGGRRLPPGLLIGTQLTAEAQSALRGQSGVRFVSLQDLGFRRLPESTRL